MPKKKINDDTTRPADTTNQYQPKDKMRNVPAGAENGTGQGAGQGSK